jgi:hypothetical protein
MKSLQEFYGEVLILQLVIREMRSEVMIDTCENNPRLVVMALTDLDFRVSKLVEAIKDSMEKPDA